uniref:Gustatory receptor n=1 Tax=Anopheles minimus TaxID=112268 RepID=A0A182WQZ6_9DIPT
MAQLCAQLRVLFFVGNVFHLIPCRYNSKTDQFETNFKLSLVAFVMSLSLSSVHMCFDWFQIWNGERYYTSRVFNFLLLLHIATFPMTIVYMLLLSFTKRVRIAMLYNELFTDRSWRFFGKRTSSWYVSSHRLGRFATAVITGAAFYLFLLILTGYESITKFPLAVTIFEAIRLYAMLVAILIYVVCVVVIKMRFKQIQERVQLYGASMNTFRQWNIFLDHYHVGVSMVNEINDNFSVLLLMVLVQVQVQLTNQFFVLYSSMQQGIPPAVSKIMMLYTQFWESSFLFILLLVGYACDSCHDQIDRVNVAIRNFVGEIEANPSNLQPRITCAWKWLDRFNLQTLYQIKRQRFLVGGMFVLDNKFVCMALTSMVTYLVILIQFRQYETEDMRSQF